MDIAGLQQALNLSLSSDEEIRKANAEIILKVFLIQKIKFFISPKGPGSPKFLTFTAPNFRRHQQLFRNTAKRSYTA